MQRPSSSSSTGGRVECSNAPQQLSALWYISCSFHFYAKLLPINTTWPSLDHHSQHSLGEVKEQHSRRRDVAVKMAIRLFVSDTKRRLGRFNWTFFNSLADYLPWITIPPRCYERWRRRRVSKFDRNHSVLTFAILYKKFAQILTFGSKIRIFS